MGRIEGERAEPAQQSGTRERGEAERAAAAASERLADSPIPHMRHDVPLRVQIAILVFLVSGLFIFLTLAPEDPSPATYTPAESQVSASAASTESATSTPAEETPGAAEEEPEPQQTVVVDAEEPAPAAPEENPNQVRRVENPYPTPPLSFETVNIAARSAIVNIFCASDDGTVRPISGSGIFIDPRGVILTNAHVAQYVLLAESGRTNLQCQIRAGSPAVKRWLPLVLYLPPVWIEEHAQDLTKERPVGTGKHDFALLYAGASLDGQARPAAFPYLRPDTREAIGFVDDSVLAASYPAEFLGAIASTFSLYPVTSITTIDELYTLDRHTVDVMSVGSVIGAQSGSSGGAIVNAWARLVGLITTTSDGDTTGQRTLRGITLSYIDRDLQAQSGSGLAAMLSGEPSVRAAKFWAETAPALVQKLIDQLR